MPEIAMKDQIRKLVELQKLDEQIYDFKKDLKEKPAMVKALQDEFEKHTAAVHVLEEQLKSVQLKRKEHELELKSKEDSISKANAQLSLLKTNKEYTAKISEIENIKADKSIFEEKILESFDESDAVTNNITKEKEGVAQEEKKFLAKKREVENEMKVLEDRVKVVEGQRAQIIPEVESNYLNRYEKILRNKENGIAIVPLVGTTCGGCYMTVPPQIPNAVKISSGIIECEICSRILYLEETDNI